MPKAKPNTVISVTECSRPLLQRVQRISLAVDAELHEYPSLRRYMDSTDRLLTGCLVTPLIDGDHFALTMLAQLAGESSTMKVVFTGARVSVATVVEAMRAGAIDVVPYPYDDARLTAAIESAIRHSRQHAADYRARNATLERAAALTPRERQIMDQVVRGLTNRAIAEHLGISDRTVETHRKEVMQKMAVNSLAELVRAALLLQPEDAPKRPWVPPAPAADPRFRPPAT